MLHQSELELHSSRFEFNLIEVVVLRDHKNSSESYSGAQATTKLVVSEAVFRYFLAELDERKPLYVRVNGEEKTRDELIRSRHIESPIQGVDNEYLRLGEVILGILTLDFLSP